MYEYSGRDDTMRATKDNLFSDALDKRHRVLIKIPRDIRTHLEALEEKDLGTLTRIPHTGTTSPEAASDAEIPEGPPPTKRKRGATSGSAPKRARETLSAAATKKAEKEKQCLKENYTSKNSQANIEQFFLKSGKSTKSKPPKKKSKPSPATMPITPEVEVPPKFSSSVAPNPKDVIHIDDIPAEPAADSGKGASSSKPPPEEPETTSAEATNTRKLHEDLRTLVLEQKQEIERLYKKEAEDQQAIAILETRLKNNEEQLAKRPSIDSISAELEVLKTEHSSLEKFLKESS
nr:pre-mRNA-splicing ATP-dependent RNA helicase prp28-like [Lolium perenne]